MRTYYLLKADENNKKSEKIEIGKSDSVEVKCQDIILVELRLTAGGDYNYVIIEDPKPAGCEFYGEIREECLYPCCHSEIRDEKIAFFYSFYPAGEKVLTYQLRAETPGTFHVMPAMASLMYNQELYGSSDELVIRIMDI